MNETVLVSGGSGFLAGWCIVDLLERGYEVRTTVRDLGSRGRGARGGRLPGRRRGEAHASSPPT